MIESKKKVGTSQKGISLFIVISALLILAVLTISITAQLMAPVFVATSATQQIVRENDLRSALQILKPIIRLASTAGAASQPDLPKLDGTPFTLEINGQAQSFALQDVNGLIDINSASRGLLTAFLEQFGSGNHIESILAQRAVKPFSTVEDFSQSLDRANTANLNRLLTVNSGRRRINSQTAPIELLQILAAQSGTRAQLVVQIDRRLFRVRPVTKVILSQYQENSLRLR
ncbi:MAG: general secretion pathway protein GspK [Rhodobacteraceae bacterium]|nr:general secretion pathway protein GspK [Paracoccaceae bacterium]